MQEYGIRIATAVFPDIDSPYGIGLAWLRGQRIGEDWIARHNLIEENVIDIPCKDREHARELDAAFGIHEAPVQSPPQAPHRETEAQIDAARRAGEAPKGFGCLRGL
jgi:hypothetical protein